MFKIVAPFVILASAFAMLNARLHSLPLSLFHIAFTLTDDEWEISQQPALLLFWITLD